MFRNLRKTIVSLLAAATLVAVPLAVPVLVSADDGVSIQGCLNQGASLTAPSSDDNCNAAPATINATDGVNKIIKTVINVFSLVVGVAAVIMIIAGGFRYITSGGDSGKTTSAKNTIVFAIVGLVVVALAQIIVQFVLAKVTSTTT